MVDSELPVEAKSMRLAYTTDSQAGYYRRKKGKGYLYFNAVGKRIMDSEELKRIKLLVIPPAWSNVWICSKPNGHLQATGVDKAGRKQYKYHPTWSKMRNERKHNRMMEFATALPLIRKRIETDLRKADFSKEKVIALAVSIMDKTHIRMGNSVYTKLYGSFGLTSLRNRHIKINGSRMIIAFKGKKGVYQEIKITHARLSRMIKKLKDLPGQELFQFFDADGSKKSLDSDSVNTYLKECSGQDFTAKDFRTWWGTVTAFTQFAELSQNNGNHLSRDLAVAALDTVAKQLGNTRTVCKKYYVHPTLIAYYEEGKLGKYLDRLKNKPLDKKHDLLNAQEKLTMEFISKECRSN